MNFSRRIQVVVFVFLTLLSGISWAIKLRASCYQLDDSGNEVHGINDNVKIEIGSVSKVVTTFWALSARGPEGRYSTYFYLNPLGNSLWDIHVQGSMDPSFGRENLQLVVARLGQLGIHKVRHFTFDQDFKFAEDPYNSHMAHAALRPEDPKPAVVKYHLRSALVSIQHDYKYMVEVMGSHLNRELPKSILMTVQDVDFADTPPFNLQDPKVETFSSKSVPMLSLLKEMNRKSNNYFANLIFESLGGHEKFPEFIHKKLQLDERDLIMLNGSGDRMIEDSKAGHYNLATCQAILEVLHGLRTELKHDGGLQLQDTMAVVGKDEGATVNIYENDWTKDAVVAKTGTVNPTVALAGLAGTKNGTIFFASLYGPAGAAAKASEGRADIRTALTQLIRSQGGPVQLHYQQKPFYAFDKDSDLVKITSERNLELHQN